MAWSNPESKNRYASRTGKTESLDNLEHKRRPRLCQIEKFPWGQRSDVARATNSARPLGQKLAADSPLMYAPNFVSAYFFEKRVPIEIAERAQGRSRSG